MGSFGIGEVESEPSLHVPVVEEGLRGVPQKRNANRCHEEHRPWLALRKHSFAGVGRSDHISHRDSGDAPGGADGATEARGPTRARAKDDVGESADGAHADDDPDGAEREEERALVGQHEAWSTAGCGHRIPNTEQAAQAHGEQVLWHAPCPPCQAE